MEKLLLSLDYFFVIFVSFKCTFEDELDDVKMGKIILERNFPMKFVTNGNFHGLLYPTTSTT